MILLKYPKVCQAEIRDLKNGSSKCVDYFYYLIDFGQFLGKMVHLNTAQSATSIAEPGTAFKRFVVDYWQGIGSIDSKLFQSNTHPLGNLAWKLYAGVQANVGVQVSQTSV